MRKRLLFVHEQMNIGGVESALIAALSLLAKDDKYDITLMLRCSGGVLYDQIPFNVTIEEMPLTPIGDYRRKHGWNATFRHAVFNGQLMYALRMVALKVKWVLFYRWRGIIFGDLEAFQLNNDVDIARLPNGFDFAFAYFGGILNGDFVSRYYSSAITAMWFHNERTRFRYRRYREVARRFDHLFACSKSLAEFFNKILSCGDLYFESMPHYLDMDEYRRRAGRGVGLPVVGEGKLRLLTVARIVRQKGIDVAILTAKILKDRGCSFVWFIVGGGDEFENSSRLIRFYRLERQVVLLGERTNPFACYRDCDLYIQPSRWEAYCLTLAEARAFGKPVVTTSFVGADEQIRNEGTGLIVPTEDVNALASAIDRLLQDSSLRKRLSSQLVSECKSQIVEVERSWEALLNEKNKR